MKCDPSSWLEERVRSEESFQHGDEIIVSKKLVDLDEVVVPN